MSLDLDPIEAWCHQREREHVVALCAEVRRQRAVIEAARALVVAESMLADTSVCLQPAMVRLASALAALDAVETSAP